MGDTLLVLAVGRQKKEDPEAHWPMRKSISKEMGGIPKDDTKVTLLPLHACAPTPTHTQIVNYSFLHYTCPKSQGCTSPQVHPHARALS